MSNIITLTDPPFASGNWRDCYYHPTLGNRCIKVAKKGRSPSETRRHDPLYKRFRSLKHFDENHRDLQTYSRLAKKVSSREEYKFPAVDGMLETNKGPGLCMELLIDPDGQISLSLRDWVLKYGISDDVMTALSEMLQANLKYRVLVRDASPVNVVIQKQPDGSLKACYIDGLGQGVVIPFVTWIKRVAVHRIHKKHAKLIREVKRLDGLRAGFQSQ